MTPRPANRRLLRGVVLTATTAALCLAGTPIPATATADTGASTACHGPEPSITNLTVTVDGVERTALVHIPSHLPTHRRAPVVITFHGAQITADFQASFDGVDQLADTEGFISVHPQGLVVDIFGTPTVGWDVYNPATAEPAFVRALIDKLHSTLCTDSKRVYAIGFSDGGGMAQLAACTVNDRIAAIASIAAFPAPPCPDAPPVPVIAFHGLQDLFFPYTIGIPALGLPDTETTLRAIATRNGCNTTPPRQHTITPNVDKLTWNDCQAPTQLYRINQQGHSWPGHPYGLTEPQWEALLTAIGANTGTLTIPQAATTLALTNTEIDATALAWQFFNRLTLHHTDTHDHNHTKDARSA